MRRVSVLLVLLAGGCGRSSAVDVRYHLMGLAPGDVIRVDTLVTVDPADPRMFYADQPYREVATGVGYEVRDLDGSGQRSMRITFDSTLGYVFSPTFRFTLLPPVGQSPPKLRLTARAMGSSDAISSDVMVPATFGATVDVTLADTRCGGQSCPADQMCCGSACARTISDVGNCGTCGNACGAGGDSCSGGSCRCAGGSGCAAGKTCCGGIGCVDLQNDPFHCGACDKACNPGETCAAGVCKCGAAAACTGVTPVCCVAGASATCSSTGTCACGALICTAPEVCCGGTTCINVRNDNANCGTCGHACTAPLTCKNGNCSCNGVICAAGDTCCSSGCANTTNDPNNCGGCGTRCAPGETCGPGPGGAPTCLCGAVACAAGQTCCGSTCVDTRNNFNNCGACGHACRQGEQCMGSTCKCNGGAGCVGNQVCCGSGTVGGGGCFDLANGPEHCGGCNKPPCPVGQMCQQGVCVASPCNPPCGNGNDCVGGTCSCNGGPGCTGKNTCCGSNGCVDLKNDPNNCNACDKKCAPDPFCCDGVCKPHSTKDCAACGNLCSGNDVCCAPCPGVDVWSCSFACPSCPGGPL